MSMECEERGVLVIGTRPGIVLLEANKSRFARCRPTIWIFFLGLPGFRFGGNSGGSIGGVNGKR